MTILSNLVSLMRPMKLKLQLSLMMMNKKIRRKYNKLQNLLKNLQKNQLKQLKKNQLNKLMIILLKLKFNLVSSMHPLKLKQLLQKMKMIMIYSRLHLLMMLMTLLRRPSQFLLAKNFCKLVLLMIMRRSQPKVNNQCLLLKSFYNQVSLKLMKSTKKKSNLSKLRPLKYKPPSLMIMRRSPLKVSSHYQLLRNFYNQVSLKLMKSIKKKNSQSKLRLPKYKHLSLTIMKRSQLKVKCQLQRNFYNWVMFNSNEKQDN